MNGSKIRRRLAGGAVVVVVGVAWGLVVAAPAHADVPMRQVNTSLFTVMSPKSVRADCPGGHLVATGFRIEGGTGDEVVTRVQPNEDMTSVVVEAKARTSTGVVFAVTAVAICLFTNVKPALVAGVATSAASVTATCPGQTRLFGFGYEVGGDDHRHVNGVIPSKDRRSVTVTTGGGGLLAGLTAYGICYAPFSSDETVPPHLVEATSGPVAAWPTTMTVSSSLGSVFGVGAVVEGSSNAHLNALVPGEDGTAGVRAALVGAGTAVGQAARTDGISTMDDGSTVLVKVDAILSGTFE
jgi:hypothetical protein